jgi:hypothetical protein
MIWVWKSWSGAKRSIEADGVRFEPEHVVFCRYDPTKINAESPILAVKNSDIGDLHPKEEGEPDWW